MLRRHRRTSSLLLALAATAATAVPARRAAAQGIGEGYELERVGKLPQAIDVYRNVLTTDSTNLPALLGLERVLPQLGRLEELVPLAQRAVRATREQDAELLGLELRTYVALSMEDSASALAQRWTRRAPGDETPWREWAIAMLDQQDVADARRILLEGRKAVGDPRAFAIELAEIAASTADWATAAQDWGDAVTTDAGQIQNAVVQLESAPEGAHHTVTDALTRPTQALSARRLGANLLLDWGQGDEAWTVFEGTLSDSSRETAHALWSFAERAGQIGTPVAEGARGQALARFATLSTGALALRARTEAARALLASGHPEAAHRLVAQIEAQGNPVTSADLIEVLVADGELDEVERRLGSTSPPEGGLTVDDVERIRIELSRGWVARGDLARAERVLAADSSVDALAQRGWIALYRGDLTGARNAFRDAGPYAGDRADATRRTEMLALITDVDSGSGAGLGAALLLLARGDSAGAIDGLRRTANGLGPAARGNTLVLAGRVAAAMDTTRQAIAEQLFQQVVRDSSQAAGAAPAAAELEWARLLDRQGKTDLATSHLEHLILAYPGSAVVPEARRLLDRLKGAVPKS